MIHGSGLLATAFARDFADDPSVLVYAQGVSNSSEADPAAFERERLLLDEALRSGIRLVYFSSCGLVNDPAADNAYLAHKRSMEARVLSASPRNLVLRLPQVVGRTPNPNTLTNFLASRIRSAAPFTVWARAERNLIDVDDVAAVGRVLIRDPGLNQRVVAVAAERSLPMPEIVSLFERVLGQRAIYSVEDKGEPLHIDSALSVAIAANAGIDLGAPSADRVIRKYYGH